MPTAEECHSVGWQKKHWPKANTAKPVMFSPSAFAFGKSTHMHVSSVGIEIIYRNEIKNCDFRPTLRRMHRRASVGACSGGQLLGNSRVLSPRCLRPNGGMLQLKSGQAAKLCRIALKIPGNCNSLTVHPIQCILCSEMVPIWPSIGIAHAAAPCQFCPFGWLQ